MKTRIGSIAVASPPYSMDQDQIETLIREHYTHRLTERSLNVLHKIFAHPSVLRRRFALDEPTDLLDEKMEQRIDRFTYWAIRLSEQAILDALQQAEISPKEVTGLIVNTCTGYICPGLSTYLIERLNLHRNIAAYDLVGSGCGGAVPNLQLCHAILNGNGSVRKDPIVVGVSVEICSSTFQMDNDLSLIVSNALFADGAAASVLWNRSDGLNMLTSVSHFAPEFRDDIRYIYKNGHLHNQLSTKLPQIAGKAAAQVVKKLLARRHLKPADIKYWAVHPGGENVINAVKDEIGLTERQLRPTRDILARYGNMSSPTVMFVLEHILHEGVDPGQWCVMLAFGAGLSAHASLLRT